MLPQNYAFILKPARKKGEIFPLKNIMSQSILSERVLQSYFSFVFCGHQMQAKTSYHKAITITVITVFQRAFYTEGRIVNSFNYRYNIIIYYYIISIVSFWLRFGKVVWKTVITVIVIVSDKNS